MCSIERNCDFSESMTGLRSDPLEVLPWSTKRCPAAMAKQYKLANRASIYRHAHAVGLFPQRERNVKAALEKIIERAGDVEVNPTARYRFSRSREMGAKIVRGSTIPSRRER